MENRAEPPNDEVIIGAFCPSILECAAENKCLHDCHNKPHPVIVPSSFPAARPSEPSAQFVQAEVSGNPSCHVCGQIMVRCQNTVNGEVTSRWFACVKCGVDTRCSEPAAPQTSAEPIKENMNREEKADFYIKASGKTVHTSDCATSLAPAEEPGPCDCTTARDGIAVVEGLMRNAGGFLGSLGITGFDTKLGLDVLEAVLYELNKAAAPQPVSGMYISETKPHKVDDARITEIFNREPVSGDALKVKEVARKLHLYHCQERRSGSICPCHVVAEGMTEGCHCKEETADIASILRRYFPPASQNCLKHCLAIAAGKQQPTPIIEEVCRALWGGGYGKSTELIVARVLEYIRRKS